MDEMNKNFGRTDTIYFQGGIRVLKQRRFKMFKESRALKIVPLSILFLLSFQCRKERREDWSVSVQFADSTYTQVKNQYFMGDTIYIFAIELLEANMPDTVDIIIESKLGDRETIQAGYPIPNVDTIILPHRRAHGGKIKSKGSWDYSFENNELEVKPSKDTIIAFYDVRGIIAIDTAYIIALLQVFHFADSTYIGVKNEYFIGDTIYVFAIELLEANMPDTVDIIIESKLGDRETIQAGWPPNVDIIPVPPRKPHGGKIKSKGSWDYSFENNELEVKPPGDTIIAFYDVRGYIATDTAYIKLGKGGGR